MTGECGRHDGRAREGRWGSGGRTAGERGRDGGGVRDGRYSRLWLEPVTDGDLPQARGTRSAKGAAGMGGECGGGWTRVCLRRSPSAAHLELSQHCLLSGYTPIQNKKPKKKRKRKIKSDGRIPQVFTPWDNLMATYSNTHFTPH